MYEVLNEKKVKSKAIKFATLGLLLIALTFYLFCLDIGFVLGLLFIYGSQHVFFSIERFAITLMIAIYSVSLYYGQITAKDILIKQKNYILTGFKYGLITIIVSTFIASAIEYLIIGICSIEKSNQFLNFDLLNVATLTLILGFPSMLLSGFLFARQIKKKEL